MRETLSHVRNLLAQERLSRQLAEQEVVRLAQSLKDEQRRSFLASSELMDRKANIDWLALMSAIVLSGDFGFYYPSVQDDGAARALHLRRAVRAALELHETLGAQVPIPVVTEIPPNP